MAKGSRRKLPTAPAWAAVVSDAMMEPRNTPCSQSNASVTSGTTVERRPPNSIAEIGTPAGSSHSGAKFFAEITYRDVLNQNLKVMDATAISLCMDNGMPIVVFNMNQHGNIRRVVLGERVGSSVTPALN